MECGWRDEGSSLGTFGCMQAPLYAMALSGFIQYLCADHLAPAEARSPEATVTPLAGG